MKAFGTVSTKRLFCLFRSLSAWSEEDEPVLRCVIVDTGEEERLERFPLQLRLDPLLRSRLCVWKKFQVAAFALCRGQTEAGFVSALCPLGRKSLSRTCSTALYILQIHWFEPM